MTETPKPMRTSELLAARDRAEARLREVAAEAHEAAGDRTRHAEAMSRVHEAAAEVKTLKAEVRARQSLHLDPRRRDSSFDDVEEPWSERFPRLPETLADVPRETLQRLHDERVATLRELPKTGLSKADLTREREVGRAQVDRIRGMLSGGAGSATEKRRLSKLWRRQRAIVEEALAEAPPRPRPKPLDPRGDSIVAAVLSSPEIADAVETKPRGDMLVDGKLERAVSSALLAADDVGDLLRWLLLAAEGDGRVELGANRRPVWPRRARLDPGWDLRLKRLVSLDLLTQDGLSIRYGPLVREIAARWGLAVPDGERPSS